MSQSTVANLQERAERAASMFAETSLKPLVIEFAGVPKAGKTTTLTHVQTFLKRCGFRTDVVVERASVCPIRDKKHANFNVWTACTTLAQVLEKTQDPPKPDDPHILFLDRGLFDSICWMRMMGQISKVRREKRELIEQFLTIDDWRKRISAVFVMLASANDAMNREQKVLPVEGGGGSIMNTETLKLIRDEYQRCMDELDSSFNIIKIDTSAGETKNSPERTAEVVAEAILSLAEKHMDENILCCPKEQVTNLFAARCYIGADEAGTLVSSVQSDYASFRPRKEVEDDGSFVQALPVVVVRRADGHVLRLRRREVSKDNPLDNKVVIWAGGHVRREDADNGNPLVHCAIRELEEELRLQIERSSLRLIGATYFSNGDRTSKHVGIIYEWRSDTNDVATVLSRTEFVERSGASLRGDFATVAELAEDVKKRKLEEPWSVEIVRNHLARGDLEDLFSNPTDS